MFALMDEQKIARLEFLRQAHIKNDSPLYKTMRSACDAHINVEGKDCINYISNNYLGFSVHPKVTEAIKNTLSMYGGGMAGSVVMCGITEIYNALCDKLADIYGKEEAAIFPAGYQCMLGTIQCAIGIGDVALFDRLAHRSLIDGAVLSGSSRFTWKHNDLKSLEKLLQDTQERYKRKLIAVDSVYSMDGDIADLPGLLALKEKYGALLLVDEAHALGVIGEKGYGIFDHYSISSETTDIVCGTFSKSSATIGGFVAGSKEYIQYLKYSATGYLYTSALPPHICAGILKTLELIADEPQWRERLWKNVHYFNAGMKNLGFDIGDTGSAVIPLYIRELDKTVRFSKEIFEEGIIAAPVYHPVVAEGQDRIRIGMSALHTQEDLDKTIDVFGRVGKRLGIL